MWNKVEEGQQGGGGKAKIMEILLWESQGALGKGKENGGSRQNNDFDEQEVIIR